MEAFPLATGALICQVPFSSFTAPTCKFASLLLLKLLTQCTPRELYCLRKAHFADLHLYAK